MLLFVPPGSVSVQIGLVCEAETLHVVVENNYKKKTGHCLFPATTPEKK